jgi:hypothetical protein
MPLIMASPMQGEGQDPVSHPGNNQTPLPAMPKFTSLAILVVGIILLVYGLNGSNSVSSSMSRAVTGAPTDKTVWLIALGIIGVFTGGFGLVFRKAP